MSKQDKMSQLRDTIGHAVCDNGSRDSTISRIMRHGINMETLVKWRLGICAKVMLTGDEENAALTLKNIELSEVYNFYLSHHFTKIADNRLLSKCGSVLHCSVKLWFNIILYFLKG